MRAIAMPTRPVPPHFPPVHNLLDNNRGNLNIAPAFTADDNIPINIEIAHEFPTDEAIVSWHLSLQRKAFEVRCFNTIDNLP